MTETRKLAAILVSDVVGYSRLTGDGRRRRGGEAQGASARVDRPEDRVSTRAAS